MITTEKTVKINFEIAWLKGLLDGDMIKKQYKVDWMFSRLSNINCKVVNTSYLESCYPEWIGFTTLHFAATDRNVEACSILLDHGADLTIQNHSGSTALHQTVEDSGIFSSEQHTMDDTFVHFLLSAHLKDGNFKNPSNNNGLSHFHIACAANSIEIVKGFLRNGEFTDQIVNMNSSPISGFTPLHFAARFCAFEVLEVLLTHGADVHAKDARGMTPLMLALERNLKFISETNSDEALRDRNEKILQLFLEKESQEEMVLLNSWGLSHLHMACTLKSFEVAKSLLENIVNINRAVNMDSPLWAGYTALHFAALCNVDTVKLLMKKGADISIKNIKGITPFDICIERYKAEDIYAVISLNPIWKNIMLSDGKTRLMDLVFAMRNSNQFSVFLKKFSNNVRVCDSALWPGYTPMHLAVLFAKELPDAGENNEEVNVQILKILCEKKPGMLQCQEVHGHTPLHLAYRLNKKSIIDLLMELLNKSCPSLIDCLDEDGLSFVHIAAVKDNISLLNQMLSNGSDVNAAYKGKSLISPTISSGSTALHLAVIHGRDEIADLLVKRGADVYARDSNDMTPIHLLLLNPKAGHLLTLPNLRDSIASGSGLSHLHVACSYYSSNIAERLLDVGANVNGIVTYKPIEESSGSSFLKRYTGYSPLLIAYEESSDKTVQLLLQRGADIFVQDDKGKPMIYRIFENYRDEHFNDFVKVFVNNEDLQKRLIVETGMTALHVACLFTDLDAIEKLISERVDVNAQIFSDSPIFQGFTPLHLILHVHDVDNVEKAIELLIEKGADVTVPNSESDTAVHMAYEMFVNQKDMKFRYIDMLLEAQHDFSVNPVNTGGINHFHVACRAFNASVVEEFLENADIDIDQPIDFFHADVPGYTPLHLAVSTAIGWETIARQLDTVDLLLKHGANVHAEDKQGDMPLHDCFGYNTSSASLDLFERLAREATDINARCSDGTTSLYHYLASDHVTSEGIKILLRMGCHLNTFNINTEQGCIGKILRKFQHEDLLKHIAAISVNFKHEMTNDCINRTVIHNIVSGDPVETPAIMYASIIEQLSKTGCDVDDPDDLGRTAVHMAAKFNNIQAISGLLIAGADVNITDNNGKTAFAYIVGNCTLCKTHGENANSKKCNHVKTFETLAIYVKKLQLCGLDVNKQNEDFVFETFEKFKTKFSEKCLKELEIVKNTTIRPHSITLHDFLSETRAVADYPRMSVMKRNDIHRFFTKSNKVKVLREKFPELAGILQLQYRKTRARPTLVEAARSALTFLTGFRLPEVCSDFILVLLTNSELKNLTVSMT